jgi:DNA anti-recombination protein RmuC
MGMPRRSTVLIGLVSVVVGAVVSVAIAAQTPAAPTDPIPALLAEVRALRLAMEQAATVGPRIQVTLARLGIQEQRTSSLSAQLDEVRRQLGQSALESAKIARDMEENEKVLSTATDERMRKETEGYQAELKRRLATQAGLEQQLRARENDALQVLSTEQARWIELNARLDELERLLAPVSR